MPAAPTNSPLTPDHLAAITAARVRGRKIRRAAGVAALSGWTMAVFALITVIGGLFGDWIGLLLGAALAVVTVNELRGAAKLRRFDPSGATLLGYNQSALAAILVLYASYMMWYTARHPLIGGAGASGGGPEVDAMLADLDSNMGQMVSSIALILYAGLAFFGLVGPGLTALYYFSRGPLVRRMLAETPDWIIAALRAAD